MPSTLSGSQTAASRVFSSEDEHTSPAESIGADVKAQLSILIVDDDHTLRESCSSILEMEGYDVTACGRGEEARDMLRRRRFDVALIDLYLPDVTGMELLELGRESNPDMISIMITGKPTVDSSMDALRAGAWDYLPKPFSATQLQVLLGRATHAVMGSRKTGALQHEIESQHGHSEKIKVLGVSPAFQRVMDIARRVAQTDASVFITGDSGTGKELIAQFIHHHSRRSRKPLVPINCAALPEPLLESEMFGHAKGAFTGAVREKPGLLEIADGGTMFLDEITEMSQPIQAKLLRVIQDGVVRRVGSTKTDAVVNVRFMAATNRNLEEAVESGALRQDLFFRLSVVPVRVPSLRERPEDIPVLAQHFLFYYWSKHREKGSAPPNLTAEAVRALQSRPWPGNVRELQNAIEHAVVFLEPGSDIRPEDIPSINETRSPGGAEASVTLGFEWMDEPYHAARDRVTAAFERRYLSWIVNRASGNMSKAARIAGIDRTTVYRLLEKHGLHKDMLLSGGGGAGGGEAARI